MEPEPNRARQDAYAFAMTVAFAICMYTIPGAWIPGVETVRPALLTSGLASALMLFGRMGRRQRFLLDGPRGAALIGLSLWAFASISWSIAPDRTWEAAPELLKLAAIYFTVINVVTTPRRLAILAGAMVLSSLATDVGTIQTYLLGEGLTEGYRAHWVGVFADPNRVAMNLVLVSPLAVAFFARPATPLWMRAAAGLAAVMAVITIVITYSRGGFIGLCVSLAVWAFRAKKGISAMVVGMALFLGLLIFAPGTFWTRTETVSHYDQDISALGRVYGWQTTSRISLDRPLRGTGLATFVEAWPIYAPPEAIVLFKALVSHNLFLDVIGELGWIGFVLFLLFAGGASGSAFAAGGDSRFGWLASALAGSVAGYLVTQFSAGYLLSAQLYVLFAMAASARHLAEQATRADSPAAPEAPTPKLALAPVMER